MKSLWGKLNQLLGLQYGNQVQIWLANGIVLRRLIGVLGMALPFMLMVSLWIGRGRLAPMPSISEYYYTSSSSFFVVVMGVLALFLIIYQGRKPADYYLSTFAGIAALLVVFFPTNAPEGLASADCIVDLPASTLRNTVHLLSAGVFLLLLAAMSIFRFTLPDLEVYQHPGRRKIRKGIHIVCGSLMVASVVVALIGIRMIHDPDNTLVFWMEFVAVEAFGISWLVKGETLFRE